MLEFLFAQQAVMRPDRRGGVVFGLNRGDAALDAGQIEYRLGKIIPAALHPHCCNGKYYSRLRGCFAAVRSGHDGVSQIGRVGRAAYLIINHGKRIALAPSLSMVLTKLLPCWE